MSSPLETKALTIINLLSLVSSTLYYSRRLVRDPSPRDFSIMTLIPLDRRKTKYWWLNAKVVDFFFSISSNSRNQNFLKRSQNNHFIFIEKSKNFPTWNFFGCLHDFVSGKTDVIAYCATYKDSSRTRFSSYDVFLG